MLQNDQDPHEWVRKDAEWVLGEIEEGVIDTVSTLIQALQDQESHVRASTTQVLDSIGKDAVPILIELLQDQDSEVSYYVALAFMTKSKILTEPSEFTSPMIPASVSRNEPAEITTKSKIFTVPSLLASPVSLASYLSPCYLRRCFWPDDARLLPQPASP